MDYKKIKIVFFGTPDFATASLRKLVEEGCDIRGVVTATDKPAGRGHKLLQSDVKKYAVEAGLTVYQPSNLKSPEFIDTLRGLDADLFIVIAFRMLPEVVWSMPRLGTFNIHGSLLPMYRGAAPINHALMNGEKKTGVTSFLLSHEIDTGAILLQRETSVGDDENVGEVYDRLMNMGAELTIDTLKALAGGNVHPIPQIKGNYPPAPKIFKDTCMIDWQRPAVEIHNHVRGLSPYPGAWTILRLSDGRELECKIFRTVIDGTSDLQPGHIICRKDGFSVVCGDGRLLQIMELKPSGKQKMDGGAFVRGYKPACCK